MKEFWKKYKFIITISVYIMAVGLAVYAVHYLLVGKIIEKSDKIQELIIDGQINKKKVDKIPEMENANEEYEKDKNVLDVILGSSGEVDFIRSLESLAESTGNKISLKIEDAEKDSKAQTKSSKKKDKDGEKGILESLSHDKYIIMQITLEGGYSNLVNFIRKLENAKYYVNVISIDAKKVSEQEELQQNIGSIFTPVNSDSVQVEQKRNKEMVKSVINVIVYTEK